MSSRSRQYALALSIFTIVTIADQLLKLCVSASCPVTNTLESWGVVRYAENPGIAFSLPLPLAVQIIIAIAVAAWVVREIVRSKNTGETLALAILLAGLASNVTDRIVRGFVVDYIALLPNLTINLADIAITISILALISITLRNANHSV